MPAPTPEPHAPAASKSYGSPANAGADESDGLTPASSKGDGRPDVFTSTSGKPDVVTPTSGKPDVGGDSDEPVRPSGPASPHDEPRPPPVIALAHVPDDPGPESGAPPEEPAVEPGSVAPPDGWSRFRARFR